nr:GyrI-like domain-containing protein [uncultured Dyadobacter sp.]
MEKLELTKAFKTYYSATSRPEVLTFGSTRYLAITGKGDPSGEGFQQKIQALYPVAYQLKFDSKARGMDFAVAKLEGLWWYDEARYHDIAIADAPSKIPRQEWEYRLLIRIPDVITQAEVSSAIESAFAKKQIRTIREVTLFEMEEGKVVQMLHKGPFDREAETLMVMQSFMADRRLMRNGLHHEIYLSDFRKTSPEKLKTILREPVK